MAYGRRRRRCRVALVATTAVVVGVVAFSLGFHFGFQHGVVTTERNIEAHVLKAMERNITGEGAD